MDRRPVNCCWARSWYFNLCSAGRCLFRGFSNSILIALRLKWVAQGLESSYIFNWWYAWQRSILENFCPPARFTKVSSIRGRCYCPAFSSRFSATLKSPQSLIEPAFFGTGTMGVAHSLHSSLVRIPSLWSLLNFSSNFGFKTLGTDLALTKCAWWSSLSV